MMPCCDDPSTCGLDPFVRRQTPESKFSHWTISDDELLQRVYLHWDERKPGYREGVVLVPIEPAGLFTSIVALQEGDKLAGAFVSRVEGETPRKSVHFDSGRQTPLKLPAQSVEVVLYSREALLEDIKPGEPEPGYDWNIISVNASPWAEGTPITPETLMANHFHDDGGTQTGMTAEEFVDALRDSYFFWKDKAFVG